MHIKKLAVLGIALTSTALLLAATTQSAPQDPPQGESDSARAVATSPDPATARLAAELQEARHQIERLRAACAGAAESNADAGRELRVAKNQIASLLSEHEEALDMIANAGMLMRGGRHQNASCKASRARTRDLLTYYQWMNDRGHAERANKLLAQVIEENGDSARSLNELTWNLMTAEECTGKYDDAALALAERMLKQGHLRHEHLDTVALAMFINGRIDEAIANQERALKGSDRDNYRRRLLVYRAARDNQVPQGDVAGGE